MITRMAIVLLLIAVIALAVISFPTDTECSLSDDAILLQQAINEGWSIIIVKNVLATSPEVILITE